MSDSDSHPIAASDVLRWAETLSGIARTGLGFTKSLYEQERFEESGELFLSEGRFFAQRNLNQAG